MSYRFVRVTTLYPQFIKRFYEKNSGKEFLSYTEHFKVLINDSVEIASAYTRRLNEIGIESFDIISNAPELQNSWKSEHNLSHEIAGSELIIQQIKYYKPEVVWIDSTELLNRKWIERLRKEVNSIKIIVGHVCAPYNSIMLEAFFYLDGMFSCVPCMVDELKKLGVKNVELIYHSFNRQVLDLLNSEQNTIPETNFIFTGSLYTGSGLHKSRIEYLEKMIENNIKVSIFGNLESRKSVLLKQSMHYTINLIRSFKGEFLIDNIKFFNKYKKYGDEAINYYSKKLIESVNQPVFGLEMLKILAKSKICFNIHGEIAKKCAGNIRLFEATGVGTCLVTDWKENLPELFDIDIEVVTYKSPEECFEKVKWLMEHPHERERIAKAGQARTLKDHSIEKRVEMIDLNLRKILSLT